MKLLKKYFLVLITILFCNTILFALPSETLSSNNVIDSIKKVIRFAKNDTIKIKAYLAWDEIIYITDANLDLRLNQRVEKLCKKNIHKKITSKERKFYHWYYAVSLNNIGNIYTNQGNYLDALKNYFACLKIREEIGDKKGIATSYNNIGNIYHYQGNYPDALKIHFASLKISEELGDKNGIVNSYNNIGIIYNSQGNYPDALKNYSAGLKICVELGDKSRIAGSYINIGIIYANQGNSAYAAGDKVASAEKYSDALKNYFAGLKISEELGDKNVIAFSYNNIGIIYMVQGNSAYAAGDKVASADKYSDALKNHFAGLKISEELGDKNGIAFSYINLGLIKLKMANIDQSSYNKGKLHIQAKKYLDDALFLSKEIGSKDWIRDSYSHLFVLDSTLGNFKSAYENFKMYIVYRDSLFNEENTKKTVQSQMQYDFDVIQTADSIKVLEKTKAENFKHQQEIKQQKIYTYGGIIGFGLMLVVAIVSFRAFRNKQKANVLIAEQKLLVEEKQKEVMDSIRYAKRIQLALLPSEKYIERNLKNQKN